MRQFREIRASFDRNSIVMYQAYNDAIADAALQAKRFVAPFSFQRMTWIKPSFLWLMERSGWATKSNQTRIMAVRITRDGWESALADAVLTSFEPGVHRSREEWRSQFDSAQIHVQWDPERSLQGKHLPHRSIQIGIGRTRIQEFVSEWIVEIRDLTELTGKLRQLRRTGDFPKAARMLPAESVYPVSPSIATRLGMNS